MVDQLRRHELRRRSCGRRPAGRESAVHAHRPAVLNNANHEGIMNKYRNIMVALTLFAFMAPLAHAKEVTLLNVSYDPTRELYEQYNASFAKYWKSKTGEDVTIK